MNNYIYQHEDWPDFSWDNEQILRPLGEVRNMQGKIMGKMESLGFDLRKEAELATLTLEVIKSTEIEGEILDPEQVRSSIAKRLGLEIAGSVAADRNVEGMVDLMMDATRYFDKPLTSERLFDWHAALFPTGRSGMYKITIAGWRNDSTGPMQVVSGAMGNEKVHYQAPGATLIGGEMSRFMDWFNQENNLDLVLKAAITHLWFVTIHPFDDGNGRIARALTDMQLARSDKNAQRFYSMSAQIRKERKQYYEILEKTQKSDLDITNWVLWFLNCLMNGLQATELVLEKVLFKAAFWNKHSGSIINERQRTMLNKLLDGFEGKLTSSKWAKIAKCSPDTALRDIQDLVNKEILQKDEAGGRSTSYDLK
jgi:Fic family protein